ncbi:MAG: hypothetical protein H7259_00020 [Cytophagales bacterium]|nr:hypothetical protein [Cytophaga sp.]
MSHVSIYAKARLQAGGPLYHTETIVSKSGSTGFNPIAGLGLSYHVYKNWSVTAEAYYSRRKINYTSQVQYQWYVDHKSVPDGNGGFVDFDIQTTFTGTTNGQFDMK